MSFAHFIKNPCNVYCILGILYSIQGSIIPTGGTLFSQLILSIAIIMGLYYSALCMTLEHKSGMISGLIPFSLILVIYGIVCLIGGQTYIIKFNGYEIGCSSYLKNILLSFPNIFSFYYFSRKGYLTEGSLRKWVVVFFCVAIFKYFDNRISTLNLANNDGLDIDGITNNMGYMFVSLMPSILIFKHRIKIQYLLFLLCALFIIWGMKRGAILTGLVSFAYYQYVIIKQTPRATRWKTIFALLFFALVCYFVFNYLMNISTYYLNRLDATKQGYFSGRNDLYHLFWRHFIDERNILKFCFGNGANATLLIGPNYAHNDWLELAINQGLLGLVSYLFYWICFARTIRATRRNSDVRVILTMIFVIMFMESLFSMSYTGYSVFVSPILGYCLVHGSDANE